MSEALPRYENGVRVRLDGTDDGWDIGHRSELGRNCYMHDVDCLFGVAAFGYNTSDRLFFEYVPDDYENREKSIRSIRVVAVIERKSTWRAVEHTSNSLSRAVAIHTAKSYARSQRTPPKLVYAIGGHDGPWDMREIDIQTGEWVGEVVTVQKGAWREAWERLGLLQIREALERELQEEVKP